MLPQPSHWVFCFFSYPSIVKRSCWNINKIMTLSCTKPSSPSNSSSSNLEQSLKSSSRPIRSCDHMIRSSAVSPNLIHSTALPLVTWLPALGLGAGLFLSLEGSLRDVTVTFVQMSHQRGLPLSKIGPTPCYALPQPPRFVFITYPFIMCLPPDKIQAPGRQSIFLACSPLYSQHIEQHLAQRGHSENTCRINQLFNNALSTLQLHL